MPLVLSATTSNVYRERGRGRGRGMWVVSSTTSDPAKFTFKNHLSLSPSLSFCLVVTPVTVKDPQETVLEVICRFKRGHSLALSDVFHSTFDFSLPPLVFLYFSLIYSRTIHGKLLHHSASQVTEKRNQTGEKLIQSNAKL